MGRKKEEKKFFKSQSVCLLVLQMKELEIEKKGGGNVVLRKEPIYLGIDVAEVYLTVMKYKDDLGS